MDVSVPFPARGAGAARGRGGVRAGVPRGSGVWKPRAGARGRAGGAGAGARGRVPRAVRGLAGAAVEDGRVGRQVRDTRSCRLP